MKRFWRTRLQQLLRDVKKGKERVNRAHKELREAEKALIMDLVDLDRVRDPNYEMGKAK